MKRRGAAPYPRIVYVVGARPNFVKMAPVVAELRRSLRQAHHILVHTGQHYDRGMSDVFLEELGMPTPDYLLGAGSGTQAIQTARTMERLEPVLEQERPDFVVTCGDVNSTLAATLVAAKLQMPLVHVESGLRSFDRSMPEEINRIVADEFSDHLFVHCEDAIDNLRQEGISEERIHFVGNTMIDTLVAMEHRFRNAEGARRFGLAPGDYLLVTLHRPVLVDGPLLPKVVARLAVLAVQLPVLFPVHPRTRKMMIGLDIPPGLILAEPLSYLEFLAAEAEATAVLTDSGGVQEETTYLGVPCFTLRENTERPITITAGTNTLLGLEPEQIDSILTSLRTARPALGPPPLWDGHAASRIARILAPVVDGSVLVG
jgi:UDP-N-acetylglucosamine 2-epimerase (non-hydrolysing)